MFVYLFLTRFETQVETLDLMRESADRDEVDAGGSVLGQIGLGDHAARLGLVAAGDALDRLACLTRREVVQHDAIHTSSISSSSARVRASISTRIVVRMPRSVR